MSELQSPDGIYASYMTSVGGHGFVMFVFLDGHISGADPAGVMFDGRYNISEAGYSAEVEVTVPAHGEVIQGASAGPEGMKYTVELLLHDRFWEQPYVEVITPLGKVNARFERLRALKD